MRRRIEDCILSIWQGRGLISTMLMPLAYIYKKISDYSLRQKAKNAWHAEIPVIVIGNIMAGGTGKTPVTQALCNYLQQQGWQVGIISRGYGIKIGNQARLSQENPSSDYLGDEPALLHQNTGAPVAVHPQRALAARTLIQAYPQLDVLIADDGLQHLALARDIEIIVQDQRGIGNGRIIPAGPLREVPARLRQVDYIVNNGSNLIPKEQQNSEQIYMNLAISSLEHLAKKRALSLEQWLQEYGHQAVNAIAGIGQPQRFFNMLINQQINLAQTIAVADHQAIDQSLLKRLDAKPILLTSKDAIKLHQHSDPRIWVVNVKPKFSQEHWLSEINAKLLVLKATKKAQSK